MFFGIFLFLLPVIAFVMFFVLLFQKKTTGLKFTFLYFALTSALGIWSLMQYQDALSFIILPFYVTAGAFGIWLFCNFKDASSKMPKAFAWLGFIVAFIIVGNFAGGGHATKTERLKNAAIEQEKNTAAAFKAKTFAERLNAPNINKEAVIRAEIVANESDFHYMAYLLDTVPVPTDSLQMLYKNQKVSSLSIMRNKNITPELIEDIYKNDSYKPYLYGDLARNQRTPEWILREVYAKQHDMFGPGGWNRAFAENPAIPQDILIKIADTKDQYVIENLLRNPKLSCDVLQIAKASLANTEKRHDKSILERISVLEQTLCH